MCCSGKGSRMRVCSVMRRMLLGALFGAGAGLRTLRGILGLRRVLGLLNVELVACKRYKEVSGRSHRTLMICAKVHTFAEVEAADNHHSCQRQPLIAPFCS